MARKWEAIARCHESGKEASGPSELLKEGRDGAGIRFGQVTRDNYAKRSMRFFHVCQIKYLENEYTSCSDAHTMRSNPTSILIAGLDFHMNFTRNEFRRVQVLGLPLYQYIILTCICYLSPIKSIKLEERFTIFFP